MAFGFLVEKFTIFLAYIGSALHHQGQFRSSVSVQVVGLALILLGLASIALATHRFRVREFAIDAEEVLVVRHSRVVVALGTGLTLIGVVLFVYLAVGL